MIRNIVATVALLAFGSIAEPAVAQKAGAQPDLSTVAVGVADTVRVAPPTGDRETDRASILAALEQFEPGATVLFAPGRYLIGGAIDVSVPRVTLLGHDAGTILRGCEPEELVDIEFMSRRCVGLELSGDHQTIRNLTFERMSWASLQIIGGRSDAGQLLPATTGGHLIEGNTFRDSDSFNVISDAAEPIVIRANTFANTYHAVAIQGRNVHVLENTISASEPGRIPYGRADIAIGAAQFSPRGPPCADNIIAGNRIDDHPDGVGLAVFLSGTSCRGNVLRDNTISAGRVTRPPAELALLGEEADTVVVGAAVRLLNFDGVCRAAAPGAVPQCPPVASGTPAVLAENLIENNAVVGGEGIAVQIMHASNNRILDNTISGIARRDGFPRGVLRHPPHYAEGNGSGIWLSPGSNGNEVASNSFEDIAASAIVIEGDSNQVELHSADDTVRDLGSGNRVTRAATAQEWADPSPHEIRYVTVAPDVRLEVLDWGGDGLPLVFLAGANFNAHSFDDFAPRFTDTHRVLGVTRRGHGASSWPDSGYDLPTLVEDIRLVLDSLGIDRAILAGHSMAGAEMTLLATQSPDRVAGLIYIDAGHDPTDIGRLRVPELCSFSGLVEAIERTFENPELVRRTQWHTGQDGARRPFASATALAGIDASLPTPDYSGVVAPALGIYYVPERTEDLFMGLGDPAAACVAAFHRYIHGGIAAFMEGVEQATVIALSETNHNIHLASPAALEGVMRQWLDSHAAPDPTDRLVRESMEALGIPAVSLVVMRHGVVLREAAYGRASLELDVPATPATVFPYASMAKVFTGTAVLRLVQGGRLTLDGRIADLLPDLPPAWSDVTVRQLLANTSGLPDLNRERVFQNPFVSSWASLAAALETLAEQPVERAPGTGFSYNQTNYLLLGMLLDRVDGRTVDEYVAEEIAGPLGLTSLAYGDSRVSIAGRARWYSRLDFSEGEPRVGAPRPLWIEYPHFLHTAAGLNGTAPDLAGFVDALASGRLLDDAHRHEMWTAVPLADGSTFRFEDGVTGAGLGWWVHDDPTHPWVGMGGAASGVVRHFVNEGLTIAVLTNLQGAEPEAIASGIAEIYLRTAAMNDGNGALKPR